MVCRFKLCVFPCDVSVQVKDIMKDIMSNLQQTNSEKILLSWVRQCTRSYPQVNVLNFTTSWADGLALNGILHHFRWGGARTGGGRLGQVEGGGDWSKTCDHGDNISPAVICCLFAFMRLLQGHRLWIVLWWHTVCFPRCYLPCCDITHVRWSFRLRSTLDIWHMNVNHTQHNVGPPYAVRNQGLAFVCKNRSASVYDIEREELRGYPGCVSGGRSGWQVTACRVCVHCLTWSVYACHVTVCTHLVCVCVCVGCFVCVKEREGEECQGCFPLSVTPCPY